MGYIQGQGGIRMTMSPVNIDFILVYVWFTDWLLSVKLHYCSCFLKKFLNFFKTCAFLLKQLSGKTEKKLATDS